MLRWFRVTLRLKAEYALLWLSLREGRVALQTDAKRCDDSSIRPYFVFSFSADIPKSSETLVKLTEIADCPGLRRLSLNVI
jgi:hypothetical protein